MDSPELSVEDCVRVIQRARSLQPETNAQLLDAGTDPERRPDGPDGLSVGDVYAISFALCDLFPAPGQPPGCICADLLQQACEFLYAVKMGQKAAKN